MALKFAVNNSLSAVTTVPTAISDNFGSMTLLQTQTASSSATIDFTSNIDSTYDSYVFKFINIHAATDDTPFKFQGSTDGGSNYNVTMTTTRFKAGHNEADSYTVLGYETGSDQAQGTSFQQISQNMGNANDENGCGELILYKPSSMTFVKHFLCRFQNQQHSEQSYDDYTAGYFNTTSAINAIQFKFNSGNIDDGIIKMYGVK